jgi:hypothetical protein
MHDQELLQRAHYDQDNGPPDDLYVIPAAYAPSSSPGAVNNFPVFSRRLRMIRYPKDFKPAIEKYDGRSDSSIWLKMYSIVARASGGIENHMAGYFSLVMGKAPLLWLDEGPIRRTREGGSEWEPIKILLEGDGNSNKMNTASNTHLRLTTQVGQAHVATGVPLGLGNNTQPSDLRTQRNTKPRVH